VYDNKLIVIGDEEGRVCSYRLVFDGENIKSFELANEFKGMNGAVKEISVTHDHDLLACVEKGGK
jgi:hypothetical protein